MITLFEAALEVQQFCDARNWAACFIGGIAVQRWSQARVTRDIDLTLFTGFGGEDRYIRELLAHYSARVNHPAQFAIESRSLLLRTPDQIGLDISLGAIPFEQSMLERATPFEFAPAIELKTCSAEDLMVMKLFASRAIDIRDAEGIALRRHDRFDWSYVEAQLMPLSEAKDDPEILRQFHRIRELGA